jgi:uncharacterized ferritin-like protein (DUF455 family)
VTRPDAALGVWPDAYPIGSPSMSSHLSLPDVVAVEQPPAAVSAAALPDWQAVHAALMCCVPMEKIAQLRVISWVDGTQLECPVQPIPIPGRPPRPLLVAPRELKSRGLGSPAGRFALLHAVAHIEFNAINLALDAMYRFRDMPGAYYRDWYAVALDESRHFELLSRRLEELGGQYGDLPAHNGLWDAACKTAESCLERMALVPRVLEARGLDVTPAMIERLERVGDLATIAILRVILSEEVGHVEVGTRWFRHCCRLARVDADQTFLELVRTHSAGAIRRPFNDAARLVAGFSRIEQQGLERIADAAPAPRR